MKTLKQNAADLTLALVIAAVVVWYMIDAYNASTKVANLLLIVPIGLISLAFLAGILIQIIPRFFAPTADKSSAGSSQTDADDNNEEGTEKIFPAMGLLALYVLALSFIGFDIATCLFVGAMLFVQGERRPFWLIGFPIIFSFLVSLFFVAMIPYPMPMAIQLDWFSGMN